MNITTEKEQIKKALDDINEEWIIKSIKRLLNLDDSGNNIVGYTANGLPITANQLKKRVRSASSKAKKGNYISQEEMEKGLVS